MCIRDSYIAPLPTAISHFRYWQFGSGQHASPAKPIRGSTMLRFRSDAGNEIEIRHIVIDGSSPWVIGRNVTRKCDIVHINGNYIRFPPSDGVSDTLSMSDYNLHSYIPLEAVLKPHALSPPVSILTGFSADLDIESKRGVNRPWSELKRIVDRVHDHTCGHASFSDIRTLLSRNQL